MSTEIYYFSGTGNSLHVARELQKRIPGSDLIPIVSILNNDTIKTNGDTIGIIFPVYFLTIPTPVSDFLYKLNLTSALYIFAIGTRGGSQSYAFDHINTLLEKKGRKLDSQLNLNMAFNSMLGKEDLTAMATNDAILGWESEIKNKLDLFGKIIIAREEYHKIDTEITYKIPLWKTLFVLPVYQLLLKKLFAMYQNMDFYSDSKCNGCGICETVCLSKKIKFIDQKPTWRKDITCYSCFACINFCPQQSIQIRSKFPYKSYTDVNGRYHHPEVTYKDIAKQRG